jgi:SAM-dependent methyltransferase
MHVSLETSEAELSALLEATAMAWTALGKTNAYWSVLTWDIFLNGLDEGVFFRTGVADVSALKAWFGRSGYALADVSSIMELGCGVGRVTRALAEEVRCIVAVDISEPHIELAKQHVTGGADLTWVHLNRIDDLDGLPRVDLLYSVITLQHNPPPVALRVLEKALDRVTPGGFAFFQVPTYAKGYAFDIGTYKPAAGGGMEMHFLPQWAVFRALAARDFEVLEVQEDTSAGGSDVLSHTFFAKRHPRAI